MENSSELWMAAAGERRRFQRAAAVKTIDPIAAPEIPALRPEEARPPSAARYFGEATFELIRRLFLTPEGSAPRSVVFCAVERGSPCGWICAAAAELLAGQAVGTVCLVDGNLANPSLHTYFETGNRPGLGAAIAAGGAMEDFAHPVGSGHLWLMTAGAPTPGVDPYAPPFRERLQTRLAELRKCFDYVVIHAPAAGSGPLAIHLAATAAGTVLILEPSFTRQQSARQTKQQIEAAGGRVVGVVLYRREPAGRRRGEGL